MKEMESYGVWLGRMNKKGMEPNQEPVNTKIVESYCVWLGRINMMGMEPKYES